MSLQLLQLLRILINPKVTATPIRVLRELRKKGIRRLPDSVMNDIEKKSSSTQLLSFIKKWLGSELISRHDGQWVINSFLPPFPGKAYNRMFENLLSGRHLSPVSAYLALTSECPFNCRHCSIKNRKQGCLTTKEWQSVIQQLTDLGTSLVGFTGGEPLQRADLDSIVSTATTNDCATILYTSGYGLTMAKAKALKTLGLWSISVSLDHVDPDAFNQFRGSDQAWDTAVNAIECAVENDFYTMTGSVASRDFIEEKRYLDIYALVRRLGIDEFRIVEPMPCGRLMTCDENALLTPEHICEIRNFHQETNRKGKLPKVCAFNQVESAEFFGCGGGTQHLFIDPAGEVCPCDFTPLSFGNVRDESLETIWERMTRAMGNPRRHCFIQKHHQLIAEFASKANSYPLPPSASEAVCARAGKEPLPDYFAMVCGTNDLNSSPSTTGSSPVQDLS